MRNFFSCLIVFLTCVAARADEVDGLIKQLKDPDSDMRRTAAKRLAEMKVDAQKAAPALIAALKTDRDLFVRRFAAQALGDVGADPKAAVPALGALLKEDSKELTDAAIASLGKMGSAAVPALVEALKKSGGSTAKKDKGNKKGPQPIDRSAFLRSKAAVALGQMGSDAKGAVPALIEALGDAQVRIDAANALGSIGSAARQALPALRDAIGGKGNKKDKNFTQAVNQAIRKIDVM